MSSVWVYVISHVWLAILGCKNFYIGLNMQSFQSNFVIHIMLIGTIDFCHFIPFSMSLTRAQGHKVSPKQNLLASFSHTLSTDQHEI